MNTNSETKTRILTAATDLFSHYGYPKTSLDDIARAAQIAKATIYYYFPSKEDIFLEALGNKAEELFVMLERELDEAEGIEDKLSCYLRLPLRYIFEYMPILADALNQIPQPYLLRLEEYRPQYRQRMTALFLGIIDYGREQGLLAGEVDGPRLSELINDWFMLGDICFDRSDKDRIIRRIERDYELIIHILLFGIIKRKT